jgi:hydroxyethylthiazole kinase-like uncharacterized protein yjeF
MKILNVTQIKQLDEQTIANEPIASIELMERAATAFVRWFTERFQKQRKVIVFCGPGNNGGDGLAIARLLLHRMYTVEIYHVHSKQTSEDYQINEERLTPMATVQVIKTFTDLPTLSEDDIIVDALFGIGLSKTIEGLYADTIKAINKSGATVVAVDIPSGLHPDKQNAPTDSIIQADYTVSFQIPKLAFMLPQHQDFVGDWYILHIGLYQPALEEATTQKHYLDDALIRKIIRKRPKFSHKGHYGKALLVAGSYGMLGAAVLATKGCLRTGAGLVKAYVPEAGFFVLQNDLPEAIVLLDPHPEIITQVPDTNEYTAIAVGPGLGEKPETIKAVEKLIAAAKVPMVIDASALNILAARKPLWNKIPAQSILTPHPLEFERLAGPSENDYQRLEKAKALCKQYNIFIILKGAHSAVVTPEGTVYFNATGNPGMATAGSGDVLTGILTALLAQGYTSQEAAILGVFLHGYAGDAAARKLSQASMLASDIIEGITYFFKDFAR